MFFRLIFVQGVEPFVDGVSSEPTRPTAPRAVEITVEIKPPLPKVRPRWVSRLMVNSCSMKVDARDGSSGSRFSRSPSGCKV